MPFRARNIKVGQRRCKPRNHCLNVRVYLNTLPPVRNAVPRSKITFPVSLLMKSAPQPAGHVPEPDHSNKVKYGEYLVTMAGCMECHTPAKRGKPLQGMTLAGGLEFRFPGAVVVSANITPDRYVHRSSPVLGH